MYIPTYGYSRKISPFIISSELCSSFMTMALKIADYAYVLETGNITKSGTGAELLADESIKEAYLGKKKS